jgi:hypothetical protein
MWSVYFGEEKGTVPLGNQNRFLQTSNPQFMKDITKCYSKFLWLFNQFKGTFGQISRITFRNCMISQTTVVLLGLILLLRADRMFHCYELYACPAPRQLLYKSACYLEFGNPCSILSNKHFLWTFFLLLLR